MDNKEMLNSQQYIEEKVSTPKDNSMSVIHPNQTAQKKQHSKGSIDIEQDRFPHCIVWTTLPCISCICPCIGHTGIGDSQGLIHDFAGSKFIGVGDFAFGRPLKYIKLEQNQTNPEAYDKAIEQSDKKFCRMKHDICCNNCHSHVAEALNSMEYGGKKNWNMFSVWLLSVFKSRYVSCSGILKTYIGFLICLIIIGSLLFLIFHLAVREGY